MNEHTPGPYHIKKALDDSGNYGIMTENGSLLAEVYEVIRHENGMRYVVDAINNANLFAAAPDLLDACEAIWRMVVNVSLPGPVYLSIAERNALTAAIAKAKGQTAEVPA